MREQGFLFAGFQPPMTGLLGRLLQLHDRHASALEGGALDAALSNRPIEQMPEAFEKAVRSHGSPDAPKGAHRLDIGLRHTVNRLVRQTDQSPIRAGNLCALNRGQMIAGCSAVRGRSCART
jgi:hypothetical protein